MAVRQILVLLDRENLSERRVAARHSRQKQLHEIADRDRIEPLAGRHLLERLLRAHERLRVGRIQRPGRRVRPLLGAPSGIERHQPAEADRLDATGRELRFDRFVVRALLLPQAFGNGEEFLGLHAFADVDAVDAEADQFVDDRRLTLDVPVERHAVEVDLTVNDVDAHFARFAEVLAERVENLRRLLRDRRVARRVRARSGDAGSPDP